MTGPEHYAEAEKMLSELWDDAPTAYAAAQVHATLALAAATALNDADGGMGLVDLTEWDEVAGHPHPAAQPVTAPGGGGGHGRP